MGHRNELCRETTGGGNDHPARTPTEFIVQTEHGFGDQTSSEVGNRDSRNQNPNKRGQFHTVTSGSDEDVYGPWMLVQRKYKNTQPSGPILKGGQSRALNYNVYFPTMLNVNKCIWFKIAGLQSK